MRSSTFAIVFLSMAASAAAQTPPPSAASPDPSVTHLHLSAEGAVSQAPDVLVGDLTAEASSPSAVDAQRKVNAMMARAMKDARAVEGVDARATGYSVSRVDLNEAVPPGRLITRRPGWTAQQTMEVRGKDGERLLSLVGKLQDEGLATSSLEWQLTPEVAREARDSAMVKALKALRVRADNAAAALGLKVGRLQDVRVDQSEPSPIRPMMAMRMNAGPPPEATASAQDITSEVSADVVLGR